MITPQKNTIDNEEESENDNENEDKNKNQKPQISPYAIPFISTATASRSN